jgi:hypothetical protein
MRHLPSKLKWQTQTSDVLKEGVFSQRTDFQNDRRSSLVILINVAISDSLT